MWRLGTALNSVDARNVFGGLDMYQTGHTALHAAGPKANRIGTAGDVR